MSSAAMNSRLMMMAICWNLITATKSVHVIAAADNIELTPKHWEIINYMREQYREHGHTPNFSNMLKGVNEFWPEADSKALYDLFPIGPAKQGAKIAGLPQPYGKGGY